MIIIQDAIPGMSSEGALTLSPLLFGQAHALFRPGDEAQRIPVRDGSGHILFCLAQERMTVSFVKDWAWDMPESGEIDLRDLLQTADALDFRLVDHYSAYCFDRFDEYSFAAARLLMARYPERPMRFADPRAALFLPPECVQDETSFRRTCELPGTLRVTAEPRYDLPEGAFNIWLVMTSLCWLCSPQRLGPLNPDRRIFLLDMAPPCAGLGDLVCTVQAYQQALPPGWTLVPYLHNTQHSDDETTNLWPRYFAPVSDVSLEEAQRSACVVVSRHSLTPPLKNPYANALFSKPFPLALNETLARRFREALPAPLSENRRVLGIVARGTDLANVWRRTIDPVQVTRYARALFEAGAFECVYLASEDQDLFGAFAKEFSSQMFFTPQKRVSYAPGRCTGIDVSKHPAIEAGQREAFGERYLFILYCLSHCAYITATMSCGATSVAPRLALSRGRSVRSGCDLTGNDAWLKALVAALAQEDMPVLLYGTGKNAEGLLNLICALQHRAVCFDRRAETAPMRLMHLEVQPASAIARFARTGAKVFITPLRGQEAIEGFLAAQGFDRSGIIRCPAL